MILKMFSVYDTKAQFFGNPFFDQMSASAIRSFGDAVNKNDPTNNWYLHPEDYQLFCIGEFNNLTGEVKYQLPEALVMASALSQRLINSSVDKTPVN